MSVSGNDVDAAIFFIRTAYVVYIFTTTHTRSISLYTTSNQATSVFMNDVHTRLYMYTVSLSASVSPSQCLIEDTSILGYKTALYTLSGFSSFVSKTLSPAHEVIPSHVRSTSFYASRFAGIEDETETSLSSHHAVQATKTLA